MAAWKLHLLSKCAVTAAFVLQIHGEGLPIKNHGILGFVIIASPQFIAVSHPLFL